MSHIKCLGIFYKLEAGGLFVPSFCHASFKDHLKECSLAMSLAIFIFSSFFLIYIKPS